MHPCCIVVDAVDKLCVFLYFTETVSVSHSRGEGKRKGKEEKWIRQPAEAGGEPFRSPLNPPLVANAFFLLHHPEIFSSLPREKNQNSYKVAGDSRLSNLVLYFILHSTTTLAASSRSIPSSKCAHIHYLLVNFFVCYPTPACCSFERT